MKLKEFQAEFNRICQEAWDAAIQETPEIAEEMTLQDLKDDVRIEIEVLLDLGIIKEKLEP